MPSTPTAPVQPAAIRTTCICAFTKARLPVLAEVPDDPVGIRSRVRTGLVSAPAARLIADGVGRAGLSGGGAAAAGQAGVTGVRRGRAYRR